jgi:CheY-like chemotaxis protein
MKILMIEDTFDKMKAVEQCIKKVITSCEVVEAMSYSEGIKKVYEDEWDLLVLDMSLPTYTVTHTESGGTKKPMAGKEIIKRMYSRKIFTPTIVITQFDIFGELEISLESLNEEFDEKYDMIWKGTVSYNKQGWEEELTNLLKTIEQ